MVNENTVLKIYSEVEGRELFSYVKKINIQGNDSFVLMECATNVLVTGANRQSIIKENLKDFLDDLKQNIKILEVVNIGDCIIEEE